MDKPLVSILIPCYNAEKWIGETLECALSQTWENKEVIVVDDGSRDGSAGVVEGFLGRGVRLISQPHLGASAARNRALEEARGELIQYLDADDLMSPDKIEVQVKRLLECGSEYVATCGWATFSKSIQDAKLGKQFLGGDFSAVEFITILWTQGKVMACHNWMISRELARRIGKWNEELTYHDDSEYFWRAVLASKGVKFCDGPICYYRYHNEQSLSLMDSKNKILSALKAIDFTTQNLLSHENSPRTKNAAAAQYHALAYRIYPEYPEIWNLAEKKARELAFHSPETTFTPLMKIISQILGWKVTRRLHRLRDKFFKNNMCPKEVL